MTIPFHREQRGPRGLRDELLRLLIPSPPSTFLLRTDRPDGSLDRLVLVDCSLTPSPGHLVVLPAPLGRGFTARRLVAGEDPSSLFGVVTWILHDPR